MSEMKEIIYLLGESELAKMGIRRGAYSPSAISCMKEIFRRGYIHGHNEPLAGPTAKVGSAEGVVV